jgi:hypothetical protein
MQSHVYNAVERALHHLALGSRPIAELSFDVNVFLSSGKNEAEDDDRHVFVSGLARAGTTIIMRRLHETGLFRSLTYRDMPFVLCPNLWERLSGLSLRDIEPVERAHGDRLKIDADSPEALDEVFWRVFAGDAYIRDDHLCAYDVDAELLERFRQYVACILRSRCAPNAGLRYLSKNNNNILRLSSLQAAFPRSMIVIPFRDPVQHANSLLTQHVNFCQVQDEDPFARAYMKWLAHHEFGREHRPFWLERERPFQRSAYPITGINYWLETWLRIYGWVCDNRPEGSILVCYEDLCSGPTAWQGILERLAVEFDSSRQDQPFQRAAHKAVSGLDDDLLAQARWLYGELRHASAGDLHIDANAMPRRAAG